MTGQERSCFRIQATGPSALPFDPLPKPPGPRTQAYLEELGLNVARDWETTRANFAEEPELVGLLDEFERLLGRRGRGHEDPAVYAVKNRDLDFSLRVGGPSSGGSTRGS